MSQALLEDAKWLESLPQNLDLNFERYFWNQPDRAKAWLGIDDMVILDKNIELFNQANAALTKTVHHAY